jgi:hypothetical protein
MVLAGSAVLGEFSSVVTVEMAPSAPANASSQVLVVTVELLVGLDQEIPEVTHRIDH